MNRSRRTCTPWRMWLIAWVGAAVLGVINGATRVALYEQRIGARQAHYLSTMTLLLLLSAYIRVLSSLWPIPSSAAGLRIGAVWTGLTVAFEFGFGRFVAHDSWSALLEQYNFAHGQVWALVPAWLALGPAVLRVRVKRA